MCRVELKFRGAILQILMSTLHNLGGPRPPLAPFLVVVVIVIYIISYLRGDMALCTGNLVDPLMLGFV